MKILKILCLITILVAYNHNVQAATITITAPTNNATLTSTPISITGTSSSALTTVRLSVGTTIIGTTTTDNGGNWNFSLSSLTSGTYALTATLINSGFESLATQTISFTMASSPTVEILSPASNSNIVSNPATISGTSSLQTGLVNIYLDGTFITTATADNNSWSTTYTINNSGPHSLQAQLISGGSPVATSTVTNLTFFSPEVFGNMLRVDAAFGNDTTGKRNSLPFATISAALAAAQSGDVVQVFPGTYVETFTIPSGVAVIGVNQDNCIVSKTVNTATDLVTMSDNTSLEDLTLTLSSNSHVFLRGVVFPGTSTVNSDLTNVFLAVDNSGASTGGTSNVYGIHSNGTGSPREDQIAIRNCTIAVASAGLGNKRGVMCDTTGDVHMRASNIVVTNNGGGSAIGAETANAGAALTLRTSTVNGQTADISQTAGVLTVVSTDLLNATANGLGFTTEVQPAKIVSSFSAAPGAGSTTFMLFGSGTPSATAQSLVMQQAVIVKNLVVTSRLAPATNNTVTVFKNGVATSLTATLVTPATTASDNTHSISFAANDLLSLQYVRAAGGGQAAVDLTASVNLY